MEEQGIDDGDGSSGSDSGDNALFRAIQAMKGINFSEVMKGIDEGSESSGTDFSQLIQEMKRIHCSESAPLNENQQRKEGADAEAQAKKKGSAEVKDGDTWDCRHYSNEDVSRMNKVRLQMLSSKNAASCAHCHEDSLTNQQASGSKGLGDKEEKEKEKEKKKKKKKKKKNEKKKEKEEKNKEAGHTRGVAAKDQSKVNNIWVCLHCSRKFCGGPESSEPEGPIKLHCREKQHWWAAHYDDPTMIYCFKCRVEVVVRMPDVSLSQKKKKNEGTWSSDLSEVSSPPSNEESDSDEETMVKAKLMRGMGSNDPTQISSPSDHMAIPKMDLMLSTPIARDGYKVTTGVTQINQYSQPIDKDVAISGSAATSTNVIRGLQNLGNSCFLNAMLQTLLSIDSLRRKILGPDLWNGLRVGCLKQLFEQTSTSYDAGVPFGPENLWTIICHDFPEFSGGTMNDSSELFGKFLGSLHDEESEWQMGDNGKVVTTLVDSMFRGQECSTIYSRQCPHVSPKSDGFCVLQLTLPQLAANTHVSIEDCFALYTKPAAVPTWHCEECTDAARNDMSEEEKKNNDDIKVYRVATKRNLITRAPDILVACLNRYAGSGFKKLEGHVYFKEMLDMHPFMDQRTNMTDNNMYRLAAVIQHIGTPEKGHYEAYVRAAKMEGQQEQHGESKSWFCTSDSQIREASLQEVLCCEAYVLVYERRLPDDFLTSADVTGEESQLTKTGMLAQTRTPIYDPIPSPQNEDELWEHQRYTKRDKRKEEELAKKDAAVANKFWGFLDGFVPSGDAVPYYRFLLTIMIEKGFGSQELNIPYSHLLSHSKNLGMDICNSYHRLRVKLTETLRAYMQKLVEVEHLNVTKYAKKKLMQHLEPKFLEMPKLHEELNQCLSTDLLREVDVFGHEAKEKPIAIPIPEKSALVQDLISYVLSKHRVGYSWEGDFAIGDIDVLDGKVVISKDPKLFEMKPQITDEFVAAMEKDFLKIATNVLKRFNSSQNHVPYYIPFKTLLTRIHRYGRWWSNTRTAEALREWIQHHPFLKVSMARANLLCGIHNASRAYDSGDDTALFKELLEQGSAKLWTEKLLETKNQVLLDVFKYKDSTENPTEDEMYYKEELEFLFEYLRHLAQHGTSSSFEYKPLARRGDGPRKQLMQSLDELELAGAYHLELAVDWALFHLIRSNAMKGMLFSVWDCYKKCNSSTQGS